jgi:hypothetical protein
MVASPFGPATSTMSRSSTSTFTDEMTRELLGFEALVFGHQYLTLSIVRLSNQNASAASAQEAFGRTHRQEMDELRRLISP